MNNNNYIICEVASIHEGDKRYLEKLITQSKLSKGDGIKFQPFDVDELVSPSHEDYIFFKKSSISTLESNSKSFIKFISNNKYWSENCRIEA